MDAQVNAHAVLLRAFPGIPAAQAESIIATSTLNDYPLETILCKEGAQESTFYILLSGEVRVTKWMNDSEERLLKNLHPGDFFGEMAIVNNLPRAATVTTTCPTTVMEIRKDAFANLLEQSSHVSMALMREVSRRLRENDEMAIEDLRLKARELAEAYQQLAEQDFARREFLTTIAHELRTPLMAANGFLQVIRSGMLQGEARDSALNTVYNNLQEITSLTNDILFLQEMELIMPAFTPTDIGAVVAAVVEQLRTRAAANQVGIRLAISPALPSHPADAKSLNRAIAAILDNAIKFSPEGGEVQVEVGFDSDALWIKIRDHGVGIAPDVMPKIFDRFFHIDRIGQHVFRGVGLGLSIARQVILLHHGEIKTESTLGQGSLFTIWLKR